MPHHLSHWYLTRLSFRPVHGLHGVYLLSLPADDGARQTREAIKSLRRSGYKVYADYSLDPANEPSAHAAPVQDPRAWYRVSAATAAATTPPQYATSRAWSSGPPQTSPVTPTPTTTARTGPSR